MRDGTVAGGGRSGWAMAAALGGLLAFGDWLLFDREVGVSLAVWAAAVVGAVRWAAGPRPWGRGDALGALLLGGAVLPVVEQVGPLSVASWLVGLVGATVAVALGDRARGAGLVRAGLRFLAWAPAADVEGIAAAGGWAMRPGRRVPLGEAVRGWLLPVVAAGVLGALLLAANPVLALWAGRVADLPVDLGRVGEHGAFWVVLAALAWPHLAAGRDAGRLVAPVGGPVRARGRPGWVNAAAVRHALWVLNLGMGVQTLMDLGFLWGGVALPEGVTAAEYAQRGAYPLVATALLAGVMALVARPFVGERGVLALLGLWLGQNGMLVLSAALRLDLYVEAFGLTRLRLAAWVWLGLVGGGLALAALALAAGRSNGWLIGRVAAMAAGVLWLGAFVPWDGVVARANLARWERTGRIDDLYLCRLGPEAGPAVAAHAARTGLDPCAAWRGVSGVEVDFRVPADESWRDWGFRDWRLRRYAAGDEGEARA